MSVPWEGTTLALTTYTTLKFLHVLLAIVAVGFNATYGVWLARAAKEPEHEPFALRGVKLYFPGAARSWASPWPWMSAPSSSSR